MKNINVKNEFADFLVLTPIFLWQKHTHINWCINILRTTIWIRWRM